MTITKKNKTSKKKTTKKKVDKSEGKRAVTTYSEAAKLSAMLLALEIGGRNASVELDIPLDTLYAWFRPVGGLQAVHRFSEEQLGDSVFRAKFAVCMEMVRRAEDMSDTELGSTFRQIMGGGTSDGGGAAADGRAQNILYIMAAANAAPGQAQATAGVKAPTPEELDTNGDNPAIDVFS